MRALPLAAIALFFSFSVAIAAQAQNAAQHPSFEILTHRMDVDVDGAPNALATIRAQLDSRTLRRLN